MLQELIHFPEKDLEISRLPRTDFVAHTAHADFASAEGYVATCLRRYTRDWVTVVNHKEKYAGKTLLPKPVEGIYKPEKDVNTESHVPEQLDADILISMDDSTAKKKNLMLSPRAKVKKALHMFEHYIPTSSPEKPSDARQFGAPPSSATRGNVKTQAMVHIKQVKMTVKQLEPFFLSVAVFDIRKKERVTENIHVSMNPEEVNLILGNSASELAAELKARKILFPLDALSPDLFLVFFLEKTLRAADVDHTVDEFVKYGTLKGKAQSKAEDEVRMQAFRLKEYRQPLGWCARCLFEKGRSIIGNDIVVDGFNRFRGGVLNESQLITQLEKLTEKMGGRSTTRTRAETYDPKKYVPVQVVIDFELIDVEQPLKFLISPSLDPVHGIDPKIDPLQLTRVAQQFSSPENVTDPNREVINDMYVFLDWANFSKCGRRARNIAIRVSLHENDQNLASAALPVMYGRMSTKYEKEFVCSVQYHEKRPSMYEQIKIRLPSVLNQGHHLLFTFAHVQCREAKMKKGESLETVFGYATFALFPNKRVVQDGSYEIPIAISSSFPHTNYMDAQVEQHAQYYDNMRPLLSFHTKLISTIYTQDPVLDSWLRKRPSELKDCEQLTQVAQFAKIQFMPTIMDRLWEVICVGNSDAAISAVVQAAQLCQSITMASRRGVRNSFISSEFEFNAHLRAYVNYEYEEDPEAFEGAKRARNKPLFQVLIDCLTAIYSGRRGEEGTLIMLTTHIGFFFEITVKSIILHLEQRNKLVMKGAESRADRISSETLQSIEKLILLLGKQMSLRSWLAGPLCAHVNNVIAYFLKDLLSLADRGWAMELIYKFIERLAPLSLRQEEEVLFSGMQWKVLRVVSDHPHYVPLCLPIPKKITSVAGIINSFTRNHFMSGMLLRAMRMSVASESLQIRQYAATVLRETMRKHDLDDRYQASQVRKRIARLYFPYLLILIENVESVGAMEQSEQRDWFVPMLWVMQYTNRRTVLQKWWSNETRKSQRGFLQLMQLAIKAFSSMDYLLVDVTKVILQNVVPFMRDLESALNKRENKPFMDDLFAVFQILLNQGLSDATLLISLFYGIKQFIHLFQNPLFVFPDTSIYCGDLAYQLLQYANVPNGEVRAASSALLYLLMRTNYRARGNFARMKLQATIAVSRFSGDTTMKQTGLLEKSLEAVAHRALNEFGGGKAEEKDVKDGKKKEDVFAAQVQQLAKTLFRVIQDSSKIQEFKNDSERMCDYMYQVSLGYAADSPDLRVTWLSNLAEYHLVSGNFEEHAQCKLMAAALVCQYLHQKDSDTATRMGVPSNWDPFVTICPNVKAQPPLQEYDMDNMEEGIYESKQFSLNGLIDLLKEVLLSLRRGSRFELAIEVYNILITIYQYQRNYDMMLHAFNDLDQLTVTLIKEDTKSARSFSSYYRVAFYGNWGSDLAGKIFIYKAEEFSHIADVTKALEEQFQASFVSKVIRLGNKDFKESDLDPKLCYWQIAAVKEYFDQDELYDPEKEKSIPASAISLKKKYHTSVDREKRGSLVMINPEVAAPAPISVSVSLGGGTTTLRTSQTSNKELSNEIRSSKLGLKTVVPWEKRMTKWERKFNVKKFILEQPFTKGSSTQSEGKPEDQWKRKIFYTCEYAFPYVNKRIPVISTDMKDLSPIEVAIEMIQEQTANFEAETSRNPPAKNSLQRVLQGSILTQVNVGAMHVANIFLSKCSEYHTKHIKLLCTALQKFMSAAEVAIRLNQTLIKTEQLELQQALEERLGKMKEELQPLFALVEKNSSLKAGSLSASLGSIKGKTENTE